MRRRWKRARRDLNLRYFALRERFRCEDGLLPQLGQQLLAVVGRPPALGHLYAESMVATLSYHLIEHYATFERRLLAERRADCRRPRWPASLLIWRRTPRLPLRWKYWPAWPI